MKRQYKLLFYLLSLCFLTTRSNVFGQSGALAFPQMPTVARFQLTQATQPAKKRRKYLNPLVLIQRLVLINGRMYTEFVSVSGIGRADTVKLPFILRLTGDSLLMPLVVHNYVPATQKARLLDSLGSKQLENSFFRFGAAVGTKWTCLSSYSGAGRWNTVTTQLREIKRTAEGELLYIVAFSEVYYGVSDYEFWKEFVISRERGLVQMSGEGMIGGEQVYVRDGKPIE